LVFNRGLAASEREQGEEARREQENPKEENQKKSGLRTRLTPFKAAGVYGGKLRIEPLEREARRVTKKRRTKLDPWERQGRHGRCTPSSDAGIKSEGRAGRGGDLEIREGDASRNSCLKGDEQKGKMTSGPVRNIGTQERIGIRKGRRQ